MPEPIVYSRDHDRWATEIRLTDDRLEVTLAGKGLIDKPRTLAIPVADLKNYALVPTVQIQHVQGGRLHNPITDHSYDAELFLSWTTAGKVKKKRTFVAAQDAQFKAILEALKSRRPDASLLDLNSDDAHRRMGFITAKQTVRIIVLLLVGLPVLGAATILLIQYLNGSFK